MPSTGRFAPLITAALLAAALLTGASSLCAQRSGRAYEQIGVRTEPNAAGVAWFGTWDAALAEARRTRRPILLMSATPTCRDVPGVW